MSQNHHIGAGFDPSLRLPSQTRFSCCSSDLEKKMLYTNQDRKARLTTVNTTTHPAQNPVGNSVIDIFVFKWNSGGCIGRFCGRLHEHPYDQYAHEQHHQHVTNKNKPSHDWHLIVFNVPPRGHHSRFHRNLRPVLAGRQSLHRLSLALQAGRAPPQ